MMKRDVCFNGLSRAGSGRDALQWWTLALVLLLPAPGAWALDQLVTKDGETLRGEFVRKTEGEIVFRSQTFGELRVPADGVQLTRNLQEGEPSSGKTNVPLTLNQTPPSVKAAPAAGDGAGKEETRDAVREWLQLPDGMTVNAGLGIGFMSGETVGENLSTSLDINYDHGRYVGSIGGRYRYGEVEGFTVTDDHRIYGGVDRYFGDPEKRKYFAMMKGFYTSDRVHLVGSQVDVFLGPGIDLELGKRIKLTLAGGYSSEWEDFLGDSDEGIADAARVHRNKNYLFEKLTLNLGDSLNLLQTGIFMTDFEDYSRFDIRLNSTLSYSLTKHLSLDLVYSLLHDDTSAQSIDETVSNLTLQLGYRL